MATLFLFASRPDPADAIPFAQVDVEKHARQQILSAPRFSGLTNTGASFSLTASQAFPDEQKPTELSASDVHLSVNQVDADRIFQLDALSAKIDTQTAQGALQNGVVIMSNDGFMLKTPTVLLNLDRLNIEAPEGISGTSPIGEIQAGRMWLRQDIARGRELLLFDLGVKLLYAPYEGQ